MLEAKAHLLSEADLHPACVQVRSMMWDKFTQDMVDRRIPTDDWARWSIVLQWVKGTPSLLDVGTAHGTFLNSLACANTAKHMVGIDIRDYSLYSELFPGFERIIADAEQMPFSDGEFETVTCMEVIEHLPDEKLERVLAELRRVAARRLIISVPFCEGIPLYKGHSQRFDPERIKLLFPNASYTILMKEKRGGTPWLMIDEPRRQTRAGAKRNPAPAWRKKLWHIRKRVGLA